MIHLQQRTILLAVIIAAVFVFTILWFQLPTLSAVILPVASLPPKKLRILEPPLRLLPYKYWEHRRIYPEKYTQISCNKLPQLEDIHYAASSWQHLHVVNGSVYLYGAYWDDRFFEPVVRVLVYCDVKPLPTLMCLLWYEGENAPVTVPAMITYGWLPEWGGPIDGVNEPYILACGARRHLPERQRAPMAVSVVMQDLFCGMPTNVLNVQGVSYADEPPPSLNDTRISVCLKWLQFTEDVSTQLVEWIEFIKAFGAHKLLIFEVHSHTNTRRVLEYYASTGFADVTEFMHPPQLLTTLVPWHPDYLDYRRELLPLNDCLYRSIHKYQWMTPIDSDEVIVPRSCNTWQEVIAQQTEGLSGLDALSFRMYYYLDPAQKDLAAPPYMKILGHLWRTRVPAPPHHNIKSFHNTSSVIAMHNHYPISCALGVCSWRDVNATQARLHHYRWRCPDESADCPAMHDTVRDDIITKYKHIQAEVDRVLTTIGINV